MKGILQVAAIAVVLAAVAGVLAFAADEAPAPAKNPVVEMQTSLGTITIELYADKAPISTENFLRYTDEKFYDGTIFHRVIRGFMIQGGGFDEAATRKGTHEPIKNEADNGLSNEIGTISMARTSVVDSATSQFFINTVNNTRLDHSAGNFGYAVFGKVIDGLDVVKKIEAVPTGAKGPFGQDCPLETVVIQSVRRKPA